MNNNRQRATILALLAVLMVATRMHLPASITHFGPVPDASWAVFFIGGFYLRNWTRWAFPLLMALAVLVASLFASVVVCHLLSQGSFYWLSDSVVDPTLAGWWKNYSDWFLPYLTSTAIYVGLATIVHVGVLQVARLRASASSTN